MKTMKQRLHNVISLAIFVLIAMAVYPISTALWDDWKYREIPEVVDTLRCSDDLDASILKDLSLLSDDVSDGGALARSELWTELLNGSYQSLGDASVPPMTTSTRLRWTGTDLDGDGLKDFERVSSWAVDSDFCDRQPALGKIVILEYQGVVHPIAVNDYGYGKDLWYLMGYKPMDEEEHSELIDKAILFATIAFVLSVLSYVLFGGVRLRLWRQD